MSKPEKELSVEEVDAIAIAADTWRNRAVLKYKRQQLADDLRDLCHTIIALRKKEAKLRDALSEAEDYIAQLRGPLLWSFGTTDPELLHDVWSDRSKPAIKVQNQFPDSEICQVCEQRFPIAELYSDQEAGWWCIPCLREAEKDARVAIVRDEQP